MPRPDGVPGHTSFKEVNGAWIAEDAIIGNNVTIFPGSVLGRPPVPTKAIFRKSHAESLPPLVVGDNCVIGANSVIYRGTSIGRNCLIGDTACIREQVTIGDSCIVAMGVTINYSTTIGARVKVMDNTHLTGNMVIEDDVFIGMLVTTANDNLMGRSSDQSGPSEVRVLEGPTIRKGASIGQGTCVSPATDIGANTVIGANSVVTKSIPTGVLALGSPARVIRVLKEVEIRK